MSLLLVLVVLAGAPSFSDEGSTAFDFVVAPGGRDTWSGTLAAPDVTRSDGPFATLDRARLAVRELRAREPERRRPVVVRIREGTYFLERPVVLEAPDSGTEDAPVVYAAWPGERPVLSGGSIVTGWEVGADGVWRARLPQDVVGAEGFRQLFVDDQRRYRPRLPAAGDWSIAAEAPATEANRERGYDRFAFTAGEIRPDWANLGDVEVVAYHRWTASRLRIAAVDTGASIVTFTGPTRSTARWNAFEKGHRYFVENVREALAEPGQWYLDRQGRELEYLPRTGEQPQHQAVVVPRLLHLLVLEGEPATGRYVEHVRFQGLTFAHTRAPLPREGHSYPQAELPAPAAVLATGARDCVLEGCAVRHVGGWAVEWGAGCRDDRLDGCEFVDLGAGGVKIGTTARPAAADDPGAVRGIGVRDCLIAHGGRLYPAAVGVWIGHADHNRVEHTTIEDFYYTGISVGWVWGYADSPAHHNEIAWNHIHTIGQEVLSDMGGVYLLGVSPGTEVHHNRIHDVVSHGYGGWGLYTDEGSTGIVLRDNWVWGTKTGSFHQHYGRGNHVVNNVLALSREWQLQRTRMEPHLSFTFERNLVFWDTGVLLQSNWSDDGFRMARNVYWHRGGPVRFPGDLTLEQWQARRDQDHGSMVVDPRFVDPDAGDFRLRPDSPATEVGFVPTDLRIAGRRFPPRLTADLPPVPPAFLTSHSGADR